MRRKKAQSLFDIIIFAVIVFLLVVGFVIFKVVFHIATTNFISIPTPAGSIVNMSQVGQQTFGNFDNGLNSLRYVGFAIIFGMIISIFVSNFLVQNHPAFFFIYIGIAILGIILSVFISNSAQSLMANPLLSSTYNNTFPEFAFVINYLPIWVGVIGLFGGVLLYLGIPKSGGEGGF